MLDAIRSRLRALFRKQQMERDLDEELRYHLDKAIGQNLRRGMTPEEARRAAIAGFGGLDRQKEGCRDARGIRVIEESWRDLRYAGRLLVKRPAFTLAVVVTLALGIGANTAVFSVADAMLLRPLPFEDQGRLAWLSAKVPNGPFFAVSDDQFSAWQNRNHTLDGIGAWANDFVNLTGYGEPERVSCSDVSDGLFSSLGVRPVIGRDFSAVDEKLEKGSLVMIGERLWKSRFGESPAAIGQSIALNGKVYIIIGVAPRSIELLDRDEVFIALEPAVDALRRDHPGTFADVSVIGRLKPGITRQAAVDDLDRILA
ncbi:MAG: ABC transporter permease, partial [Blastocatellia bacterium]